MISPNLPQPEIEISVPPPMEMLVAHLPVLLSNPDPDVFHGRHTDPSYGFHRPLGVVSDVTAADQLSPSLPQVPGPSSSLVSMI
jgi:hypothetical protein